MARDSKSLNRRDVLKATDAIGTAGLAGLMGCTSGGDGGGGDGGGGSGGGGGDDGNGGDDYPVLGNFPIEGDTVTFGLNVSQSGPYVSESEDELRAHQLAAKHLNEGDGWIDSQSDDLSGSGMFGCTINYVDGDTAMDADQARQSASGMTQCDDTTMISDGSFSAVITAVQELCQNKKVMFVCCLTHSNDTIGKDCVRYSFREMFNAYITGQTLAPVVRDVYSEGLQFYQPHTDYSWGQIQQASMEQFMTDVVGWEQVESVAIPLGTSGYLTYFSEVQNSGTDVLISDYYGLDGANSVQQAIDAGIDKGMEIIAPLYNRLTAQAAGDAIEGIYGIITWDSQIDNTPSQEFTQAFRDEYDQTSSGLTQLAYARMLQYTAAVECAGTFYPPEATERLEDYEYDNIGIGSETMCGRDHQAQRDVPAIQGLPASEQSEGTYFNIVNITSRDDSGYACDAGPAAEYEFGSYEQTLSPPLPQ